MHIEALRIFFNDTPKLLGSLRQHMPFGIEPGQTRPTQAQHRPIAAPDFGIKTQQLAAQFRHIGPDLKRLFKFINRLFLVPLAFVGNPQADMCRNTLGISVQHLFKGRLRMLKLAPGQESFAQNTLCFQIIGVINQDMLCRCRRLLRLVFLKQAASLIIHGLQADSGHMAPPADPYSEVKRMRGKYS